MATWTSVQVTGTAVGLRSFADTNSHPWRAAEKWREVADMLDAFAASLDRPPQGWGEAVTMSRAQHEAEVGVIVAARAVLDAWKQTGASGAVNHMVGLLHAFESLPPAPSGETA